MVERKSGLARLVLSADRTALKVSQALIGALTALRARVLTLTNDNGHEFALHDTVAAALGCQSYFAKPYASYQRGTMENLNGVGQAILLERQKLAKEVCNAGIDFLRKMIAAQPSVQGKSEKFVDRRLLNYKRVNLRKSCGEKDHEVFNLLYRNH
jgi:IS30 family transposase